MVYSRTNVCGEFFACTKVRASFPVMEDVKQVFTCFLLKGHKPCLQVALRPKVFVRQAMARALTLQLGISKQESIPMSVLHESSMSAAIREVVLHFARNEER
jgi:hypothetical protein